MFSLQQCRRTGLRNEDRKRETTYKLTFGKTPPEPGMTVFCMIEQKSFLYASSCGTLVLTLGNLLHGRGRARMDRLISFRTTDFVGEFSKRANTRGRAYSMKGYISRVHLGTNIDVGTQNLAGTDAAVEVSAKCCASYRKKRKHGVKIRMSHRGGEFHLVRCECECEAGEGERCSHVCGVLQLPGSSGSLRARRGRAQVTLLADIKAESLGSPKAVYNTRHACAGSQLQEAAGRRAISRCRRDGVGI